MYSTQPTEKKGRTNSLRPLFYASHSEYFEDCLEGARVRPCPDSQLEGANFAKPRINSVRARSLPVDPPTPLPPVFDFQIPTKLRPLVAAGKEWAWVIQLRPNILEPQSCGHTNISFSEQTNALT